MTGLRATRERLSSSKMLPTWFKDGLLATQRCHDGWLELEIYESR